MKNITDRLKTTGKITAQKEANNSSDPHQHPTPLPTNDRREQNPSKEGLEAPQRHGGKSGRRSRDNFGSYKGY